MSFSCLPDEFYDSLRAKDWKGVAPIIQLADRLQIALRGAEIRFSQVMQALEYGVLVFGQWQSWIYCQIHASDLHYLELRCRIRISAIGRIERARSAREDSSRYITEVQAPGSRVQHTAPP